VVCRGPEDEAVFELERSCLAEGREVWWGDGGRLFLASGSLTLASMSSPDSASLLSPFSDHLHQQEDSGSVTRSSTFVHQQQSSVYSSTTFTGSVVILREDSVSWARPRGSLSDSGSVCHR
jgi:hypothetical protein